MNGPMIHSCPQYIPIYRGDDTDFRGNRRIIIRLHTDLDMTGCTAHFKCLSFEKNFGEIPESKELELVFTSEDTKQFKLGFWDAELYVLDPDGKRKTVANTIRIHATNSVYEAYCIEGDRVICADINPRVDYRTIFNKPTLNGVVIEGDKTSDDYHIVGGGGGLSPSDRNNVTRTFALLDGNAVILGYDDDSKNWSFGGMIRWEQVEDLQDTVDDIYSKLDEKADADNTYTRAEIDDKITRFVAHYLTAKVDGRFVPFATHAALAYAKAHHTESNPYFFYAGQPFTPTKNDYCVVLADETVDGKTTRYSYVGEWPTGAFQYQYTINDTAFSQDQWAAINSGIDSQKLSSLEQVSEAANSHMDDFGNPHQTTAEQVGARPSTWTPTAEEVGARPATWTPTAEEVGAATVSQVDAVDAKIDERVSTDNRFLVDDTSASIQEKGEDGEWKEDPVIRFDKGYDAVETETDATETISLDKSVQTVVTTAATLLLAIPQSVSGTVRDLCVYVFNQNGSTGSATTISASDGGMTVFQDENDCERWNTECPAGGQIAIYLTEIPGMGWRASRSVLKRAEDIA